MNTTDIKQSHNIVDYINQYVPLSRAGATEYKALCPFHSEKSPSFTVSELKQFYYCHGCGATGDLIAFVEQYQGVEFIDACKILGGQVDEMDVRTVAANRARPIITYPKFDKRDAVRTNAYIDKCDAVKLGEIDAYQHNGEWLVPIIDMDTSETVNLYNVRNGKFLCGGVSHRAVSYIKKYKMKTCLIVVNFDDALKLTVNNINDYEDNIFVAYSAFNLKLIVDSFHLNFNFIPVLTADDTHAHSLTNSHDYIFIDGDGQFIEKVKGEDFE
jgi:hypothetical protein